MTPSLGRIARNSSSRVGSYLREKGLTPTTSRRMMLFVSLSMIPSRVKNTASGFRPARLFEFCNSARHFLIFSRIVYRPLRWRSISSRRYLALFWGVLNVMPYPCRLDSQPSITVERAPSSAFPHLPRPQNMQNLIELGQQMAAEACSWQRIAVDSNRYQ